MTFLYWNIGKDITENVLKNQKAEYGKSVIIDRNWVFALIKAESNFKPNSVSTSGATGLMQIMGDTANEIAKEIRNRGGRP